VARVFKQNLSPRLIDFLEIASYVYSADCATPRGLKWADDDSTEPWTRDFSFAIAVRDLEFWARAEIQCLIEEILNFLSNDKYSFTFVPLQRDRSEQPYFDFADAKDWPFHHPDRVIMFSGGLDSLAGAIETAANGCKVVLVSHRSVPTIDARQNTLFQDLQKLYPDQLIRVPVWVNKAEKFGREPTQRTRSFLFSAVGTLVAHSIQANGVRFYENGVVSLNLPIAQEALRSRASRTTHPWALHLLSRLCAATTGGDFVVDNPYLSKTKSDVVASIGAHHASHLIGLTCSCSRSMFQSKAQPHCGHCSQCIDRRFATVASGLQEHDPAKRYASDVFLGVRDEQERAIALDYVRHGLELARKTTSDLTAAFNLEINRAVRHVEKRSQAAQDIIAMHKRHGEVVSHVLEQVLSTNAAEIVGGGLPPTSLLAMIAGQQHLSNSKQLLIHPTKGGADEAEATPPDPQQAAISEILATVRYLRDERGAGPKQAVPKNKNARPSRRDTIIFAAITLGLEGLKYSAFLRDHVVPPKWEKPCPGDYDAGYKAGQPWRKKIQDEKCRANVRMKGRTQAAIADAFNFYLPDRFQELSDLLNSRNSRPASKTSASPKPRKH